MAFLITGLRDLTNPVYCYGDNERKEFREKYRNMIKAEAKRWLLSDDNTFGSFIWACEIFDLDPAIVRAECQKGTTGNIRLINYVKSKALVR